MGSAIVPAFTYDAEMDELYLISTGDGNDEGNGFVNLFKLSGPATEPSFELLGSVGVPEPWENWSYEYHGDFLPQLGSDQPLNSVDARMHTMISRNNKLWAVHHIYLPANDPERCAIQWWCFDTTGVILERDRIDDPDNGYSFAFPSIAVNANEDVMVGHGVFSSTQYAGAAYSFKAYYDEEGTTRDFYEYKAGLAPYYKTYGGDRNRWGDYSAVFVDPVHDVNFWAMHEYAELPAAQDQWGTWWAYYRPSFPPQADFESDEIIIPVGETVNFTDLTLGVPEEWQWTFEGGTPELSDDQHPQDILYDTEGEFNVTLIATNELGADTLVREGWITASTTILPEVNFTVDNSVPCSSDTVSFQDQTNYSPIQWLWEFHPPTVVFVNGTDENSQHPQVVFEEVTTYAVTLTSWNLNGSSDITKADFIHAGGYSPYYKETFEAGSYKSEDWTIENPDLDITWELFETGGTLPGSRSMGIDFYNYFSFSERDRLISPPFNLTVPSSAYLQFEHAYARRHPNLTDSLLVYISDDCGSTWTRIFSGGEDGSGNFATHEPVDGFWPMVSDDWCMSGWGPPCTSLDLSAWAGKANIKLAFESWSAFGNPLFIDNIEIGQFVGFEEMNPESNSVNVFPNPAKDGFKVLLGTQHRFQRASLINHLGQEVHVIELSDSQDQFEILKQSNWQTGMYFLVVAGDDAKVVKKVSFH
jgi:PKD repeat protein